MRLHNQIPSESESPSDRMSAHALCSLSTSLFASLSAVVLVPLLPCCWLIRSRVHYRSSTRHRSMNSLGFEQFVAMWLVGIVASSLLGFALCPLSPLVLERFFRASYLAPRSLAFACHIAPLPLRIPRTPRSANRQTETESESSITTYTRIHNPTRTHNLRSVWCRSQ